MAALALIAGSILGWAAAIVAAVLLDATLGDAVSVFFFTTLSFACSLILLAHLRTYRQDQQDLSS